MSNLSWASRVTTASSLEITRTSNSLCRNYRRRIAFSSGVLIKEIPSHYWRNVLLPVRSCTIQISLENRGYNKKNSILFKIYLFDRTFFADFFNIIVYHCKKIPWRVICTQSFHRRCLRKKRGSAKCHVTVTSESMSRVCACADCALLRTYSNFECK